MIFPRALKSPAPRIAAPALALAIFAAGSASANIIIDSFDEVAADNVYPISLISVGLFSVTETDLTSVLGGRRTTTLIVTSLGSPGPESGQIIIAPQPQGVFDFSSSSTAIGSAALKYAGGVTDFSDQSGFAIDFLAFDHATNTGLDVMVLLHEGANTLMQTITLAAPITTPETIFFDASQFTGAANLAAIDSVEVKFMGGAGTDFRIDEFRAVTIPVPATFVLCGLLGLAGTIHRRRTT